RRQQLTVGAHTEVRRAISVLLQPMAASRIIRARLTSRAGAFRLRVKASKWARSSSVTVTGVTARPFRFMLQADRRPRESPDIYDRNLCYTTLEAIRKPANERRGAGSLRPSSRARPDCAPTNPALPWVF